MPCIKFKKKNNAELSIKPEKAVFFARLLILRYIFIPAGFLLAANNHLHAQTSPKMKNDLGFMRTYDGKYAGDAKLFQNTRLKTRLQKLLGTQYNYFIKNIWQVETPIKIKDYFFYAWAMQEHSGGDPAATLLADFHTNTLYIEIVKDHKIKLYAEDGSTVLPKPLADWAATQGSH